MSYTYPTPRELGIKLPADIHEDRFNAGFAHALKGGKLDKVEYFRRSFGLGFRTAKLYLRELRRRQGIAELPVHTKFRLKVTWR